MANSGTELVLRLSTEVDAAAVEALLAQIEAFTASMSIDIDVSKVEEAADALEKASKDVNKALKDQGSAGASIEIAQEESGKAADNEAGARTIKDTLKGMILGENNIQDEETAKQVKALQVGQQIMQGIASKTQGLVTQSFGVLEMIYGKLKEASPLLQAIESLFNLAMTLFFMPLGNKLAEVLLPAVLDLVDNVVSMWDAMEGMTLSQMIDHMMTVGVSYFAEFFYSIGDTLIEQGGILENIGDLINSIGSFLENSAVSLLNSIINIVGFVVSHLKEIIALLISFYAMQVAMNLIQIYATVNSGLGIFGSFSGVGIALAATGVAAGVAGYAGLSALGLAEGGYVPATDGGQVRVLGEGGEGEYVVPESKVDAFVASRVSSLSSDAISGSVSGAGGGVGMTTNYYYYINGYTSDDVIRLIRDEVSSQVSQSRIRGSF